MSEPVLTEISVKGGDMMPRTSRAGVARTGGIPGTLKRSSKEARETFMRAHENAVRAFGEGDQADRAAYVEFKQKFDKRGDHWIPKQPAAPED
jgi:ChaB